MNLLFPREFVIIYRKILLSCLTFLSKTNMEIRGYIVFYVISLSFWIHYKADPYFSDYYNQLELRSLLVSTFTVYLGLFFLIDFSDFAQALMFIFIIGINAHFLLMWTTSTLKIAIESLVASFRFAMKLGPLMKPIIGLISGTQLYKKLFKFLLSLVS